jgi:hypothetical protein
MMPATTDTGCWLTLCGPRMTSLKGAEPGVVAQDKPVHWMQIVVWIREGSISVDEQTYVTVNCLHQQFKTEAKPGPRPEYMHEFNLEVPLGMDLKDSELAQARKEQFASMYAKVDVWVKGATEDAVIGTAELSFAELGAGKTSSPVLRLVDPVTADAEEKVQRGTLNVQASIVGEPTVGRMSSRSLSPELLGLAPQSNMSKYAVKPTGCEELPKDLLEVTIGNIKLHAMTTWGKTLALTNTDYFLEIIVGDVMTVTPLLRAGENGRSTTDLRFNCTRFVRITEGATTCTVQLKAVPATAITDLNMPFQTYNGAQLIAELTLPLDELKLEETFPGRASGTVMLLSQPEKKVETKELIKENHGEGSEKNSLLAELYFCSRLSAKSDAALMHDDRDLYLVGDRVIIACEQDYKYPATKEEFRKSFCTSLDEMFVESKKGGPMPLREPADSFEKETARLPGSAWFPRTVPLPQYTQNVVPCKFELPANEHEFKKRGCEGLAFWTKSMIVMRTFF